MIFVTVLSSDSITTKDKLPKKKYNAILKIASPVIKVSGNNSLDIQKVRPSATGVIMRNLASLRYYYSKRLKERDPFNTKIVAQFSIDSSGSVLDCKNITEQVDDSILVSRCLNKIKSFKFKEVNSINPNKGKQWNL